ncbi:MAG: mechanosensitive ion channel family protein [Adhaeribacter sp.]
MSIIATPASAQLLPSSDTTSEVSAPQWLPDSLGRRTPRGTVAGFIDAVADENYTKAALYLNLDSTLRKTEDRENQARALQRLLDKGGRIMPYSFISDKPEGNADDNLGPNLDRVGTATANGESFDLILEKSVDTTGAPLWLFSAQTFKRIPADTQAVAEAPVANKVLPKGLKDYKWGGVSVGHWLGMVLLAVLAYLAAWGITIAVTFIIRVVWHKSKEEPTVGIIKAFALPIRLYLAAWILVVSSQEVGISIIVRQRFSETTVIVGLVAILLLIWRLLDVVSRFGEKELTRRGIMSGISVVLFLRRAAKIALIVLGIITILGTLGFDVTTGIAALGIGGIALALGAQKTVENFVGSVTLIADQPIRVGDFCRVGQTLGTVEQIGMRSTRLRTSERTIVTIPNGEFASLQIENFAHRDRILFAPKLRLHYQTTTDQIREILKALRTLLAENAEVDPTSARVRFIEIAPDSRTVEIYSYILTNDYNKFLSIQEELILSIMEIVQNKGQGFAFPAQNLYLAQNSSPNIAPNKSSLESE